MKPLVFLFVLKLCARLNIFIFVDLQIIIYEKNTYLKLTTPSLSHLLNHFLDLCQKTHDTLASPFVMILHHGFSAFCFLMQFLQS